MNVGIVSLGCAKNLVDSEIILSVFKGSDFDVVDDPNIADVIIVNTCGFIESAKKESIETILEMAEFHKPLVVCGCLTERYKKELQASLPEVSLFISIEEYPRIKDILNDFFRNQLIKKDFNPLSRVLSTPSYTAYLRISEGCNNCCTYCAIPIIRGKFRSRPFNEIIEEAKGLAKGGIKELVVIAQDTTRYGEDFSPRKTIVDLLEELLKIQEFVFIRLLYLYPDEITDELIDLISREERLTPYFDLPLQHASNRLLKDMNRRGDKTFIRNLISKIRLKVPNAILRTTMIVGFPGESENDFNELLDFIKEIQFNHLGAFTYSREAGTKSYSFKNQIPEATKKARLEKLVKVQQTVSYKKNKEQVGEIMRAIVMRKVGEDGTYFMRAKWNAPDGVDGNIILKTKKQLNVGDVVNIRITGAFVYDISAELV